MASTKREGPVEKLERELDQALDEFDRVNRDRDPKGRETARLLCGLQCRIYGLRHSIELRQGNYGTAEKLQRMHLEWEKARAAAEREAEKEILHEVMAILEEQQAAQEAMQELSDADIPDFNEDEEP